MTGGKVTALKLNNIATARRRLCRLTVCLWRLVMNRTQIVRDILKTDEAVTFAQTGFPYTTFRALRGDVQIITIVSGDAAGAGCMAAIDVEKWLEAQSHAAH
jgi:hypothetical protein